MKAPTCMYYMCNIKYFLSFIQLKMFYIELFSRYYHKSVAVLFCSKNSCQKNIFRYEYNSIICCNIYAPAGIIPFLLIISNVVQSVIYKYRLFPSKIETCLHLGRVSSFCHVSFTPQTFVVVLPSFFIFIFVRPVISSSNLVCL